MLEFRPVAIDFRVGECHRWAKDHCAIFHQVIDFFHEESVREPHLHSLDVQRGLV